jgi:beta-N-acetylhexosaminidase
MATLYDIIGWIMSEMREKIGQLIMVGVAGKGLTPEERRLLRNYPFGGFILFSHNLEEPEQIVSLSRSLWDTATELRPFIAVDQEGGRVHRLPPPFTHFPPAAALGRTANADLAYETGLATARELSAAGINLNFAPVFDVHTNPGNPIIGDRSLGSDPEEVIRLGWEVVRGLREGGVIPCVKHFPGHGGTAEDSHLELPVVPKDAEELETVELPPFVHACANRVEAMMTAHVLYPALDQKYPATLSTRIIGELLRAQLRYDGVVFSDDLEMKAVSGNYSFEEAVQRSLLAGVDVLLFCHEIEKAAAAFDFISGEIERNNELKDQVERSYRRIRKLKTRKLTAFTGASPEELEALTGAHRKIVAAIQGSR